VPIFQFTRHPDGAYPHLPEELQGLMVFPDEEVLREEAVATLVLNRAARHAKESMLVDPVLVTRALSRALEGPEGLRKTIAERTVRGQVAGKILRGLLDLHESGKVASVAACVADRRKALLRYTTFGSDEKKSYGERSIKAAWSQFRSVAHYWAAADLLKERLVDPQEDPVDMAYGAALWMNTMQTNAAGVIVGSMLMLERAQRVRLRSGTRKPESVFADAEPWVPPLDFPMPLHQSAPGVNSAM
jgi:hypothetical protein